MKRIIVTLLVACVALPVMAATALGLHYYLLSRSYQKRLGAYKKIYADELPRLVADQVSPEDQADVHALLSYAFLNEGLGMLVGPEWQLSSKITLNISRLHFTGDNGTPLMELLGRLSFGGGNSIDIEGVASVAPLAARDGQFVTRLQIVALKPTVISQG